MMMLPFSAVLLQLACGQLPSAPVSAVSDTAARVQVQSEVAASRSNAIVLAARKVSPAVVSVIVTQTRIVSYDPFGGFGFDDFFRDFFPRHTFRQEIKSMGSGVIVSTDGHIVTNAHVVRNATAIKVTLPDNRQFDAELVDSDDALDLALLKVTGGNLPAARLGSSSDLMIGEWAIAIGNPFGFMMEDAQPTVTVGVISALRRDVKSTGSGGVYSNMIQTDAAINPGNSGGPLVNALGEVVGINTFIFSHAGGSEGIGFARPIEDVKEFMAAALGHAVASGRRFETALGATVADITPPLRSRFGLVHSKGVVVVGVKAGSIADNIGLAEGDVILMNRGKVVRDAETFASQVRSPSGLIDIVVDRRGQPTRLLYRLR